MADLAPDPAPSTSPPDRLTMISRAFREHAERVRVALVDADRRVSESTRAYQAELARADAVAGSPLLCACGCGAQISPELIALAARRKQRRIYATPSCRFRAHELREPRRLREKTDLSKG